MTSFSGIPPALGCRNPYELYRPNLYWLSHLSAIQSNGALVHRCPGAWGSLLQIGCLSGDATGCNNQEKNRITTGTMSFHCRMSRGSQVLIIPRGQPARTYSASCAGETRKKVKYLFPHASDPRCFSGELSLGVSRGLQE
jgi:hypothetical protein